MATAFTFGPSVSVDVVARGPHAEDATALRGWLVQRLIEEGYTIAPSEQADRVLTVHADGEAVSVGSGSESFEIDLGPAAVMRLEALHRARMLIEHAEPMHPSPEGLAVLGMRTAAEASEGNAGVLESALLRAGYALTPRPRPGDPVLCVVHAEHELGASLTTADATCPAPVVFVGYDLLAQPEGAEVIVSLLEDPGPVEPVTPAPSPVPSTRVDDEPPAPVVTEERRFISRESEFRLGTDVGLVARGDVDAYARFHMRLGKLQGPGALVQVSTIPSRSGAVRTLDTTLTAGPDFRLGRRKFAAEFGLVAGALVHAYSNESVRGGSASWYVGLPASISLGRSWDRLRFHLFTEAFLTGGRLRHLRENAPDWARTAWGLRAGLGITWGWRIS